MGFLRKRGGERAFHLCGHGLTAFSALTLRQSLSSILRGECLVFTLFTFYFHSYCIVFRFAQFSDKKVLKGNINIAGGTVKDIASGDKSNMFEVQCSMTNGGGDILVLSAPTAEEKVTWMECLKLHASASGVSEGGAVLALKQKLAEFKQDHIFNFVPGLSPESQLFKQVGYMDWHCELYILHILLHLIS